jgi:hypothetical protein
VGLCTTQGIKDQGVPTEFIKRQEGGHQERPGELTASLTYMQEMPSVSAPRSSCKQSRG